MTPMRSACARRTPRGWASPRLSDLRRHPDFKFGFSNEFMDRSDGWPGVRARYGLPQRDVRGLDHDLAYRALASGEIQATELYSTDAEIKQYNLRVLRDDLGFFPSYECVWLYRADLKSRSPAAFAALARLEGRITSAEMAAMNARAKLDRVPEDRVAADFLAQKFGIEVQVTSETFVGRLLRRLGEHLTLVAISLTAAIVVSIPLGVIAARRPRLGPIILTTTGLIQTIPSLALLVFMIPWLGIGAKPALVALFLYSLLPIVRNTASGLRDIPVSLRESAEALGLPAARTFAPDRIANGVALDPGGDQDGRGHQRRHRHDRRPDRGRRLRPADLYRAPPR